MINIRNEEPSDYRVVEEITRDAFWNLYMPGCDEHFLMHNIRKHEDYIPELSFVIEYNGEIVGSIIYTYAKIVTESGEEIKIITFGPVSIKPELHRKGLGRALITHSIEAARKMGHRAIVLGGYPYHYKPYGFVGSKKYGIAMSDGKYYTGIMALPLYEGALDKISGKVVFSSSMMEIDSTEMEEFEKTFPPKVKEVKESQKEFEMASTEIDTNEYN